MRTRDLGGQGPASRRLAAAALGLIHPEHGTATANACGVAVHVDELGFAEGAEHCVASSHQRGSRATPKARESPQRAPRPGSKLTIGDLTN